ncbi:hypothetical protein [Streptomyces hygroscopicus]|nr:hypothetical protein [Streptomyces hygroscopicus]
MRDGDRGRFGRRIEDVPRPVGHAASGKVRARGPGREGEVEGPVPVMG